MLFTYDVFQTTEPQKLGSAVRGGHQETTHVHRHRAHAEWSVAIPFRILCVCVHACMCVSVDVGEVALLIGKRIQP